VLTAVGLAASGLGGLAALYWIASYRLSEDQ
jgi:hypothetical protein